MYEGIPYTAAFCRFIQSISNTSSLQKIFDSLVQKAFADGVMNGTQVVIDASNKFFLIFLTAESDIHANRWFKLSSFAFNGISIEKQFFISYVFRFGLSRIVFFDCFNCCIWIINIFQAIIPYVII